VDAHIDNALSFDGLPIAPVGACRPFVDAVSTRPRFSSASLLSKLGFFREMSWKLVNDALLA